MPKRGRTLGSAIRDRPAAKRGRSTPYRRSPPKRSYAARLGTKVAYKTFRKQFLRTVETKSVTLNYENIQVYHNTMQAVQNLLATQQGTTQVTRVGDKVYGTLLSIKLWLSNKLDRPNVQWRIILFTYPDNWSSGTSIFDPYAHPNKMIGNVDTDKYTVIRQLTLQPLSGDYSLETGASNKEHSRMVKMTIPLNREIKYKADGGQEPTYMKNRLALAIIPYDSFGTLVSDNIASFAIQCKFYYKDP